MFIRRGLIERWGRPPLEILAELRAIEQEILQGIEELEGMLRCLSLAFRYRVSRRAMNTLVLPHRQLPDGVCRRRKQVAPVRRRRLKAVATANRRSMNQEAILALEAGLPCEPIPQRPTAAESRRGLEQQVWTLPVLDDRSAEEILGYGDDGLCR